VFAEIYGVSDFGVSLKYLSKQMSNPLIRESQRRKNLIWEMIGLAESLLVSSDAFRSIMSDRFIKRIQILQEGIMDTGCGRQMSSIIRRCEKHDFESVGFSGKFNSSDRMRCRNGMFESPNCT